MEWILNDLSLKENFENVEKFTEEISKFLQAKDNNVILNKKISCSRELGQINVVEGITFQEAVLTKIPRILKSQVLRWVTKDGPYWNDARQDNADDYFEFEGEDVTDLGLGECARRIINLNKVTSYSFDGAFDCKLVDIQHGLPEEPYGNYPIPNIFGIDSLVNAANEEKLVPTTWDEVVVEIKEKFISISFSDDVNQQLSPLPFSLAIYESLCSRFTVLEELLKSRGALGNHTPKTKEIIKNYFSGDKAWFSDESDTNKRSFKDKLTFRNLDTGNNELFPFHGKIKSPQIRIHFNWPIKSGDKYIQIVYIGPKITKK
jgi:hypothetical protein